MLTSLWLALGGMLYSLQLSTGSFPKPLTPEEEQHYLSLAAEGDIEARNILIERNLRLVAHIMKKYYAQESDQEDLISIGTIGLIKAISTYRMDKNIKLATYASRCIENAITTPMRLSPDMGKRNPETEYEVVGAILRIKSREQASLCLLPAALFDGLDDRIQKFQLLLGRTVHMPELVVDHIGVYIRNAPSKLILSVVRSGVIHDHMDRRASADNPSPPWAKALLIVDNFSTAEFYSPPAANMRKRRQKIGEVAMQGRRTSRKLLI